MLGESSLGTRLGFGMGGMTVSDHVLHYVCWGGLGLACKTKTVVQL